MPAFWFAEHLEESFVSNSRADGDNETVGPSSPTLPELIEEVDEGKIVLIGDTADAWLK